jgi:beta-galactosidase GanA
MMMKTVVTKLWVATFVVAGLLVNVRVAEAQSNTSPDIPRLHKQGTTTQLLVDRKPFVILGGELHNSSASSPAYMEPIWPKMVALNLNTVLAVVSWELLEPEEGRFDFALVDGLLDGARQHNLRLVLLWFGSWKNGVSSYVPGWVKRDVSRFPRMQPRPGENVEVLTPLSEANCAADARAFAALMRHLKEADGTRHTVLMVQVENEVGLLGASRDHSPPAEAAFAKATPGELMTYLSGHRDDLIPEFKKYWEAAGLKAAGTWTEVFGEGADEAFMAWHMARYLGKVAAAGKAEYSLPMYANAWLVQSEGQKAGAYPSGGPVSKVLDVWRAAAPAIDFLAPDIYLPDFKAVCASYTRSGNPLFIPESSPGADRVFYAIGQHETLGFCPFAIDSLPADHPLKDSYQLLAELMPVIIENQGAGRMCGLLQYKQDSQQVDLAGYHLEVSYRSESKGNGYGLVIASGPDEFLVAGSGVSIHFSARTPGPRHTRILSVEEGRFKEGKWVPGRRMNGDENAGGWRLQLPGGLPSIQRISLYHHD